MKDDNLNIEILEDKRPNGWIETTLGEVCEIIMGQSPKGETYNLDYNGLPFYQGVTEFDEKYVKIKTYTSEPTKIIEPNTILFSVRAPVGRVNFTKHKSCIGRGNAGLKMNNGNQEFLFYLLKFLEKKIQNRTSGTVFDSISGKELKEIPIIVPKNPEEQKTIASVLSAFDDKIELLREQNKTLEEIAQTIFQEWFGKYSIDRPEELPEGWRVGTLGDILQLVRTNIIPSKDPKTIFSHYSIPSYDEGKKPIKELGEVILSNKYRVIENSFLVSKLNPATPRIWTIFDPKENAVCSTEFQVLKPINENYFAICHCFLNSKHFTNELIQKIQGTSSSHQRVKPQDIIDLNFIIPSEIYITGFHEKIKPFLIKINYNSEQIQALIHSRDELINKLMRGEIKCTY